MKNKSYVKAEYKKIPEQADSLSRQSKYSSHGWKKKSKIKTMLHKYMKR